MKTDKKKPDEPYQDTLPISEPGDVSLSKIRNYKGSFSIGFKLPPMHSILCVFDTGAGLNLTSADVLDHRWLDIIRQSGMPESRSASDTRLVVSGILTLHLLAGELHTLVAFDVMDKLAVLVLIRTTFIDTFIKSIHQTEEPIFTHHSPTVPTLLVHEAKRTAEESA